jgi:hypothetical protein
LLGHPICCLNPIQLLSLFIGREKVTIVCIEEEAGHRQSMIKTLPINNQLRALFSVPHGSLLRRSQSHLSPSSDPIILYHQVSAAGLP